MKEVFISQLIHYCTLAQIINHHCCMIIMEEIIANIIYGKISHLYFFFILITIIFILSVSQYDEFIAFNSLKSFD
jgi:hypothetical protein